MPELPGAAHGQHDGTAPDESPTDARPSAASPASAVRLRRRTAARAAARMLATGGGRIRVRKDVNPAVSADPSAAAILVRPDVPTPRDDTSTTATLLRPAEPATPEVTHARRPGERVAGTPTVADSGSEAAAILEPPTAPDVPAAGEAPPAVPAEAVLAPEGDRAAPASSPDVPKAAEASEPEAPAEASAPGTPAVAPGAGEADPGEVAAEAPAAGTEPPAEAAEAQEASAAGADAAGVTGEAPVAGGAAEAAGAAEVWSAQGNAAVADAPGDVVAEDAAPAGRRRWPLGRRRAEVVGATAAEVPAAVPWAGAEPAAEAADAAEAPAAVPLAGAEPAGETPDAAEEPAAAPLVGAEPAASAAAGAETAAQGAAGVGRRWAGARAALPNVARRALDVVCGAGAFAAGAVVVAQLWAFLTRPLWGDELWRAYYVSKTGKDFFHSLPSIDAPLPAGFVVISKVMIRIFGNTELALKSPVLCALPLLAFVTYRLCRRVAGPITSLVAGGTVVVDSAVLVYATQYKQYVIEALAAAVAMLLFLRATEAVRRAPRLRNAFGAGVAALFGSPVIFILLPLGVAYLVRAVVLAGRRGIGRPAWLRTVGLDAPLVAVLAVGPGLVHAATYLRWQGARVRTAGNLHPWVPDYLPGHGTVHWLQFRLASWVPEFVVQGVPSPPDLDFPGLHRPSDLAIQWITIGLVVGFAAGAAAAWRVTAARWLLVAIVGGAGVGLLLSAQHIWPFSWARVNLFMVPLLHVLVAAGVGALISAARYVRGRWQVRAGVWAVSGAALACCVAGAVAAIAVNTGEVSAVRPDVHRTRTLGDMRAVVEHVRETAAPTDVAIVPLGNRAFVYYMDDYSGYRGQASDGARIPEPQVFSTGRFSDPASATFVKNHPHAEHVYVFEQRGISSKVHRDDVFWMGTVGFRPQSHYGLPGGGLLTVFTRP